MERKEKKRRKNAVKIQRKIVINQCKGEAKAPIIMGFPPKDLLHRVTIEPVARQLIPFKDISQLEQKINPALGINVILAYTEFKQHF